MSDSSNKSQPPEDFTIPSRATKAKRPAPASERPLEPPTRLSRSAVLPELHKGAPWLLEHHWNGELQLDAELSARYPNMPLLSLIHFRTIEGKNPRGIAALATSDESVRVTIEVDAATNALAMTFTLHSLLGLRFIFARLNDNDRFHWLDTMRRGGDEIAFLWGATRWEQDYLISVPGKRFTNFYAFSPHHIEAAAHLTTDVTLKLLDWLERFWKQSPPGGSSASLSW